MLWISFNTRLDRKILIWKNYNSLKQLSQDSIDKINEKTGIPIEIAKKIKQHLKILKVNNE